MIIKGSGSYKFNFEIEVDIPREEFDILSQSEQDQLIQDHIDPSSVDYIDSEIDEELEF